MWVMKEVAVTSTLYRPKLHIHADAKNVTEYSLDEMLGHRKVFTVETEELLQGHKFLMESWVQSMEVVWPNTSPVFC